MQQNDLEFWKYYFCSPYQLCLFAVLLMGIPSHPAPLIVCRRWKATNARGIVEDRPLDPPFLSRPLGTSEAVLIMDKSHHQFGIAHVTQHFYQAEMTGKSIRTTFAATGN
jgi:hypothetical protein